ncbi:hypothetical protein HGB47_14960 [Leptospira yasudae]|uniref:hypothetical protein n=1 Tax=Leptospira yasudae TaxID=2202201 RepID=UPI001C50025B|nr:hypothetical protein [Leptospira yasudae]MBW0434917.1 hypothetical protein [Leptospira yasudae]
MEDKIVIGGSFFPKEIHITFHFGGYSEYFDIHFKNEKTNKYYPFIIVHKDQIQKITYFIVQKLINRHQDIHSPMRIVTFRKRYKYFFDMKKYEKARKGDFDFIESLFLIQERKKRKIDIKFSEEAFEDDYNLYKLSRLNKLGLRKTKRADLRRRSNGFVIGPAFEFLNYWYDGKKVHVNRVEDDVFSNESFRFLLGDQLFSKLYDHYKKAIPYLLENNNDDVEIRPIKLRAIENSG